MKPEDFRRLFIQPGTLLSLVGEDYGGLEWDYEERIKGVLKRYLIIEHHHHATSKPTGMWDTAMVLSLPEPLQTDAPENYAGTELLLLQRYPDHPWDNEGQTVWVFGIHQGETLPEGPV